MSLLVTTDLRILLQMKKRLRGKGKMSLILKFFLGFQESTCVFFELLPDKVYEVDVNKRDGKCGLQNWPSGNAS